MLIIPLGETPKHISQTIIINKMLIIPLGETLIRGITETKVVDI